MRFTNNVTSNYFPTFSSQDLPGYIDVSRMNTVLRSLMMMPDILFVLLAIMVILSAVIIRILRKRFPFIRNLIQTIMGSRPVHTA
nr:protein m119.4 [Mastomys natalensis cytomegalovirus 3]WEG69940.1 protein m119.4 [Mastomys natalensis cytomegalovirus 3]WEG70080.1 protein m119.4 [Mastomys natalensis cytomegalovirus 3]WEG70220.1 protein m119.4 [Mastomys natalensis cytomegalovirus 3]WEG70360.1 protein m119.4 [Mastomys natalensis cytomegalovirus 3]